MRYIMQLALVYTVMVLGCEVCSVAVVASGSIYSRQKHVVSDLPVDCHVIR